MFGRKWFLLTVLLGTGVVPYLMSTSTGLSSKIASLWPRSVDQSTPVADALEPTNTTTVPSPLTATARDRAPSVQRIEEVFRFEITPAWVLGNWPRVSANLSELELHGYRVPLVTGTTESDLAGSLTYYFNSKQRLERITFFGTTGDARKLVALLESRFQFQRQDTKDPGLYLYQVKSWTKVSSEMRIRPMPIIRSGAPHARFEVALLIERPA